MQPNCSSAWRHPTVPWQPAPARGPLVRELDDHLFDIPQWLDLLGDVGRRSAVTCQPVADRGAGDAEAFRGYGFDLAEFNRGMEGRAAFVNTRNRGSHRGYAVAKVPGGGELASAWEVHRAYVDTDVLVSLTKLKSHVSGGITGGLKNLFGLPPMKPYGRARAYFHHIMRLSYVLVDLARIVQPTLNAPSSTTAVCLADPTARMAVTGRPAITVQRLASGVTL